MATKLEKQAKYPSKIARAMSRFSANLQALAIGRHEEVAEKAGLSRVYISYIIHGHSVPRVDAAASIASALGKTLDEMLYSDLTA